MLGLTLDCMWGSIEERISVSLVLQRTGMIQTILLKLTTVGMLDGIELGYTDGCELKLGLLDDSSLGLSVGVSVGL